MDKQFFEFWKDFFVKAAESQKAMESMALLMRQGMSNFEQMSSFMQKACNLERMAGENPDYLAAWKKAQEEFQKSLTDYMGMVGVVPASQHVALVKKYEELKEKCAQQEETIKHLRMIIAQEQHGEQDKVTGEVQNLIQQQTQQFQKMMEGFTQMLQVEPQSGAQTEKPAAEKPQLSEKKKKS